jgi:hypothetical protein
MWQSNRWLNYESIRGNGPLHPIAFGIVLAAALTTALERRKRPLSVCRRLSLEAFVDDRARLFLGQGGERQRADVQPNPQC